ncbi:MAG: hypothetical protein ABIP48_22470 [Planctomycetota bacterium]
MICVLSRRGRRRCRLRRRITGLKSKVRNILAHYSEDIKERFTRRGEVQIPCPLW